MLVASAMDIVPTLIGAILLYPDTERHGERVFSHRMHEGHAIKPCGGLSVVARGLDLVQDAHSWVVGVAVMTASRTRYLFIVGTS